MTGALLQPIAESLKNTLPSTSFPTPQGSKIATLTNGIVATRSADGACEYIHVLRPPAAGAFLNDKDRVLRLPPPKDGKRFSSAVMLRSGRKAILKQDENGVTIRVPWQDAWHPLDTVIKLTH